MAVVLTALAFAATSRDRALRAPRLGSRCELVGLLLVLAVGSDMLTVEVRSVRISGSFLAIVLAMALLGPAPAAAIGAASVARRRRRLRRRPWTSASINITNYTIFPLVGGVLLATVASARCQPDEADGLELRRSPCSLVFMVTNFLNFLMVAVLNASPSA